jgi:hypothetical protein
VRVERVVLEHHRDVALFRRHVVHDALADADVAARNILEPGDHAQQGGFPAARGADQDHEFAVADVDRHTVDDLRGAVSLAHVPDFNSGHL